MSAPDEPSSEVPSSSTAPAGGGLLQALGLDPKRMISNVWESTFRAIQQAGYEKLEPAASGDEGATGVVLLAREKATGRRVALKVITDPQLQRSRQQLQREREVLSVDGLPSSVVRYYTCLESEAGAHQPVLVLEYIDGRKIHRHAVERGLSRSERLSLCRELFRELAALHSRGLLHSDLSPNNVLVETTGRLRFIDFGISRVIDRLLASRTSVVGGGTTGYARAHVLCGERRPEPHDDVYGAAAISFLVLTGKPREGFEDAISDWRRVSRRWQGELQAAGVPRSVAELLVAALAPLRSDVQAGAVCSTIDRAFEAERAMRRRVRSCVVALAVALPLVWAGFEGWGYLRARLGDQVQRSVAAAEAELSARPNLEHPAVSAARRALEGESRSFREAVRSENAEEVLRRGPELERRVRAALELSREIEVVEPLRASLGEVLAHTPWVREVVYVSERWAELSRRHQELGRALDRGEMQTAWTELRKLQAELAALAAKNASALRAHQRAHQARADYRSLEQGVAERLRALPPYVACAKRAAEAERLLGAGELEGPVGTGAVAEFAKAKTELLAFLKDAETPDEASARLSAEARRGAELVSRLVALEAECKSLETLRDELRSQLEPLQKALDQERGLRTAAEKERDALAKAKGETEQALARVRSELETLKKQSPVVASRTERKQGDRHTTSNGMVFVGIAPQSFQMGSPENESGPDSDEKRHRVTITQWYGMAETEVTQRIWREVMGTTPWKGKDYVIEGDEVAATHVSWNEAVEFCKRLTQREQDAGRLPEGFEVRLPTEAEWELAARAGSTTAYAFGDDPKSLGEYAVFDGARDGLHAHRVKSRKPNAWGLYDMAGNTWEWCLDAAEWNNGVVTSTYRDGVSDPLELSGPQRVYRGGGWRSSARYCRSALRLASVPGNAVYTLGFRPVLAARSKAE